MKNSDNLMMKLRV